MRYWIEEHYWMICTPTEVDLLETIFPVWAVRDTFAENLEDVTLTFSGGQDGRNIHGLHFRCSIQHVPNMHDTYIDTHFNHWAAGVGPAIQEVHSVIASFFVLHDTGKWEITKGFTTVTSGEDADNEVTHDDHLMMTLHHTEKDLSLLYRSEHEGAWLTEYRR